LFWNIAGLGKKEEEFWEYICKHDFICLMETWMERKGWEGMKAWLPNTHEWMDIKVRKEEKRERTKGGMLLGKRKGWGEREVRWCCRGEEGLMVSEIREGKYRWIIVSIYNRWEWKDLEQILERVVEEIEDREDDNLRRRS